MRAGVALLLCGTVVLGAQEGERPRARAIGLAPGVLAPGALNAITDVEGVRVGHVTLIEGDRVPVSYTHLTLPTKA
jgi:D-aminopeptidase